tara:strand:- start:2957 stop:3973 length:1017 start_codon:yes stop_codon:yes gene_type:complete
MNKYNILFVSPYSFGEYGGVQSQIIYAKKYLELKGHNVKILAHKSGDFEVDKSIRLPFNGSVSNISLSCDNKLLEEAVNWSDIVHIHEPFIPLLFWRINTENKIVITTHHAALNKFFSYLLMIIYKIFNFGKGITSSYVSIFSKDQASSLSSDIVCIPNFYENKNIINTQVTRNRLTFLGRSESRKGVSIFIKSIDSYILNELIPTIITNKNVNKTYIDSFLNPSDETKFELLNETRLLVVPYTKNESFGVVILEAIFNGCVVICSDIPVFKNILNETGIYFDNKNSRSLNSTIKNSLNLDLDNIWKRQYQEVSRYKTELVMTSWIELYNTKMLGSNK